jgi:hypothetical protein
LAGTLNRIEAVNKRYNTADQQEILRDHVINHLRFLHLNSAVIRTIIETPAGQTTGINIHDYLFESEEFEKSERIDEAASPMEMFNREFDELMVRARAVASKYNDPEQQKEFDLIVMSRLRYIDGSIDKILDVLKADPDANLGNIIKSLQGKLKYAKAQTIRSAPAKPPTPEEDATTIMDQASPVAEWKPVWGGEPVYADPSLQTFLGHDVGDLIKQTNRYPVFEIGRGSSGKASSFQIEYAPGKKGWIAAYSDTVKGLLMKGPTGGYLRGIDVLKALRP